MLSKLNEQVEACRHHAHCSRLRADGTDDAARKEDFLEMEKRWLNLARGYERLCGLAEADSEWRRWIDRRVQLGDATENASGPGPVGQERDVDAFFERMWLASIVDSSDDAIISKNLDGIITSWNRSAERLFGYRAEEAIGKSITIIIPQERIREEDMILEHIRRGERVEHFETARRRKDGSIIDISLTVSPIVGTEGTVGASKIARDITGRKRAEEDLRKSEERFR
ncbi:MAG: PAS domain S-box protein, partial [Bradyrhizobiaceae bacterium]|nr:PAS domain S-box protein [Bradyrhizobiaceae bacterium]